MFPIRYRVPIRLPRMGGTGRRRPQPPSRRRSGKLEAVQIRLPEHISLKWTARYAAAMLVVQLVEGTHVLFAALHAVYVIAWIVGFNVAGGFRRVTGAYVFFFGLLTIIAGTFFKAILIDPADSNSWTPLLSMSVYTVAMVMLVGSIWVSQRIIAGKKSLAQRISEARPLPYRESAIGCFVIGALIPFSWAVLPVSLVTILTILNMITPLGIIMGTIYVIHASGGRRVFGWVNGPAIFVTFMLGLAGFSKQGMFGPLVGWLVAIAYMRFRLRWFHMAGIALTAWFCVYALVPISQMGRDRPEAMSSNVFQHYALAYTMLEHIQSTRREYTAATQQVHESERDYFNTNLGFADRLTRWPADDRLISYTSHGNVLGYAGPLYDFLNWFPHLLFPNKEKYAPPGNHGNFYAREIGLINIYDTTTGVSFAPPCEAFHMGLWVGVCVFLPLLWIMFFSAAEWVCGDVRATPWGLAVALLFAHLAPEGGVDSLITYTWYGNMAIIFSMIFATYVAPVIGTMVAPQPLTPFRHTPVARRNPASPRIPSVSSPS